MTSFPVLPVIFYFILNESVVELVSLKSAIASSSAKTGSFLQYCYRIADVFEKLSLYSIRLYIGITTSIS